MGIPQSKTSPNIKAFELMCRLTRALWITRKVVITDSCFCVLKGLFEMKKRGFIEVNGLKRGSIGLGGFMEKVLTITSDRKILVMWNT